MLRSAEHPARILAIALSLLVIAPCAVVATADEMPDTTKMSPLQLMAWRARQMSEDANAQENPEPTEFVLPEGVTRVTNTPGDEGVCSWSPDGKALYLGYREKSLQEVRRIDLDTGETTPVSLPMESAQKPDISPDGKFMVFVRTAAGTGRKVWVMRLEDSEQAKLTTASGHDVESDPVWSHSGRKIYMTTTTEGIPFGAPTEVTREGDRLKSIIDAGDRAGLSYSRPMASPSGRKTAWSVRSGRRGFIQVIDNKITSLREEFEFPGYFINGQDWLPGEREMVVAYLKLDAPLEGYSLGRVNLESGEFTPWLDMSKSDINPCVSPDGKRVAFTAKVDGHNELFIAELP